MPVVTAQVVQDLLKAGPDDAGPVVPIIAVMARSYTRGRGFARQLDDTFVPNAEIAAVITMAAARMAANVRQTSRSTTTPDVTTDVRTFFQGWNLAELAVLNRYRVRAK